MTAGAFPPVDAELAGPMAAMPHSSVAGLDAEGLEELRAAGRLPVPEDRLADLGVEHVDLEVPRGDGSTVTVALARPRAGGSAGSDGSERPALVFLHGGGQVMGDRFSGLLQLAGWVADHDAVGLSVEYRLAPEHPWPAAHDDVMAVLRWVADRGAEELGVDPDRVVLVGASAGGGLAAGAALRARDEGHPPLLGLMLMAPMLDDRGTSTSARQDPADLPGPLPWDAADNAAAWTAVLGEAAGTPDVPSYAAPGRAVDGGGTAGLADLPRTFVDVGAVDLFRDECVALASGLWAAGVDCELHVWAGAVHGFTLDDSVEVAAAALAAQDSWLRRVLSRPTTPPSAPLSGGSGADQP